MKCKLCYRESNDNLCNYHQKAYLNLTSGFEKWCKAYKRIDWETYIQKVFEMPDTGIWVKDCCKLESQILK